MLALPEDFADAETETDAETEVDAAECVRQACKQVVLIGKSYDVPNRRSYASLKALCGRASAFAYEARACQSVWPCSGGTETSCSGKGAAYGNETFHTGQKIGNGRKRVFNKLASESGGSRSGFDWVQGSKL